MKKFRDIARKDQPFVDDLHRILNHMQGTKIAAPAS
jgi:hypothetical protein